VACRVEFCERVGKGSLAAQTVWSRKTIDDFSALLKQRKPEVIHVHNTFPLISPSLYWVAARERIPVVQTLHNFRLLCPQAMFLRDGRICESCLGKTPVPALTHGCYHDSRSQTSVLVSMIVAHRLIGTFEHKVTRYIALNAFGKDKFVAGGLPVERIRVKPNFVERGLPEGRSARSGYSFVGRLSQEKGLDALAAAARLLPAVRFEVVGTGPQVKTLEGISTVNLRGAMAKSEAFSVVASTRALIFPSIWYETFGLVVVEAFSTGTPVIASRIGGIPGMVKDGVTGLLFNPGDSGDLAEKIGWAEANPERMAEMGRNARAEYEARYTPEQNYSELLDIYEDAIAAVKQ